VDEEELLVSVNNSSLGSRSKGPRAVGPSGGVGSALRGSATGVTVWLEEASGWLSVCSSLSSSACRESSSSRLLPTLHPQPEGSLWAHTSLSKAVQVMGRETSPGVVACVPGVHD
jgi:hypothetical protein